ncbi:TPA: 30S ribosomal protein S26e [Candidatus Bathyarchaeota archaeon]|nr:30S ribosomal protein S26e [Candidatus Bathyarchaeota archaeon]
MTKKRKSRGRGKGKKKGRSNYVYCSACNACVPRDKAKKVTARVSVVDPALAQELRVSGARLPSVRVVKYYCISCAVYHRVVKVRAREERRFR